MTWEQVKPAVEIGAILLGLLTTGKATIWWERKTNGNKVTEIQEKYDLLSIEVNSMKDDLIKCKEGHTRLMDLLEAADAAISENPEFASLIIKHLRRIKDNL